MEMRPEQARQLAARLHDGQTDKSGAPYIEHLLAVAHAVAPFGSQTEIAGLLHDSIEDTSADERMLRTAGVPGPSVSAVVRLTRPSAQEDPDRPTYQQWVASIADLSTYREPDLIHSTILGGMGLDPLARIPRAVLVKIADNAHNMRVDRQSALDSEVASGMTQRYTRSICTLISSLEDVRVARLVLGRVNPDLIDVLSGSKELDGRTL